MEVTLKTLSSEESMSLGSRLAALLKPGDVITLAGDLGAGKTTFTKGLARGLGVKEIVNSPTFTIIKEYNGNLPLYHMDVYRLNDEDEDLGFEEYFSGEGVTVVEWAERIQSFLPEELLQVEIKILDDWIRQIHFYPVGKRYETICKELERYESISD